MFFHDVVLSGSDKPTGEQTSVLELHLESLFQGGSPRVLNISFLSRTDAKPLFLKRVSMYDLPQTFSN